MIGSTVSHYKILERLGGGAMGVVYKARDLRLERFVALKFLAARKAGEGSDRRRFLREAKAASALDHPNICTVYEIDETGDGGLFIAMAFCEGETLTERILRGPLPVEEAVALASQIAAGLEAAHEKGVVHRDIKPANVIVTPDNRAKIVDFGIARLTDGSRITRAGIAIGTAAYMPPEQFRGEPADARSDVWSLGVVLYEMLTGRLPFQGPSEPEYARSILTREPRPPSAERPGVPAWLDGVVARALAKKPIERYPSAGRMRAALASQGAPDDGERTVHEMPTLANLAPAAPAAGAEPGLEGRVVSHYRILEPLGGGGMGVVYKARDLRLERTVALKFLPPELTRDPEAMERFLQEARAASALEHPNLCTILEVGETDDGRLFLAMPCYDGETLKRRIERGPLPFDEAADLAFQMAKGLAKAHKNGIVHRDIKPANIVVTSDGVVKILDFGVAKLAGEAAITRPGSSLGTPAYMAPEQARGEPVDPRADLWSLGVVLYEMLAGRRPFVAEREAAVLYAILNEPPKPVAELRKDVPPDLARIVSRLMEKDPGQRYPSADEVLADLRKFRGESLTGTMAVRRPPGEGRRRVWMALAGAAAVAIAAGAAGYLLSQPRGDGTVASTFAKLTDQPGRESFPSLSPDGAYFVYTRLTSPSNLDIYLQRVGGGNPINLTADSPVDDTHPAYSPDGQQIAFRSERDGGGIFVMGATGESVRRATTFGYNPAWSPDGKALAVATEGVSDPRIRSTRSEIWKVAVSGEAGGTKELIASGDAVQPSWSPGGQRIAYWGIPAGSAQRVLWTVPAAGGEPRRITQDAHLNWSPVWSPDGKSLYFASDRGGILNLWRVPIEEATGEVLGEPQPVTTSSAPSGLLSLSRDGSRIVFASDDSRANLEHAAFDPESGVSPGSLVPVTEGSRAVRSGRVSPDGQWIAFDTLSPQEDLFLVRPDGGGLRQLTDDPHRDRIPRWSPDGTRILFYSDRSGRYEAWTIRPDGSGLQQVTKTQGEPLYEPVWSPDGRQLVCVQGFSGSVLIDLTKPLPVTSTRPLRLARGHRPFFVYSWSPDGRRLVGAVRGAGLAVYSFAAGSYERVTDHGRSAFWLSDSRRFLYTHKGRVFLFDSLTRAAREVLAPPPFSRFSTVSASPDDRTLYVVRATEEGDVWMLTLR